MPPRYCCIADAGTCYAADAATWLIMIEAVAEMFRVGAAASKPPRPELTYKRSSCCSRNKELDCRRPPCSSCWITLMPTSSFTSTTQSTLFPAAISAVRHPATQTTVKHLDVRRRERRGRERRGSASAGRRARSGFARAAQAGISPESVIGCQHRYSNRCGSNLTYQTTGGCIAPCNAGKPG